MKLSKTSFNSGNVRKVPVHIYGQKEANLGGKKSKLGYDSVDQGDSQLPMNNDIKSLNQNHDYE